ncbi:hypothetical protein C922_02356 [Plasmodium inui San Antonio 1]|uniref:Uncharacterized protein n=1 Tax=Plasmodium inui San Antonio 1 TaxID=1237626 RepID=W7AP91_9APIC|nr:hypothetical protein C922_02356 [Plasmodium inui San Antonio 1]EUD67206.1 hypothetical protein C922_02356 [Plasmodium inui San Antonio 1]
MKGTTSRSGSINLYNNITDSLSKLKTIIKYNQENDVDKGGGKAQQGKAPEGGHCKLAKEGPNEAAKYPFLGGTKTADGNPTHRQRDERKAHRKNNTERELLRSIAKANSLKKIEKNISLLLRSDDEEGEVDVEEEKEDQHLKKPQQHLNDMNHLKKPQEHLNGMNHLKQPQQNYYGSDECVAVGRGTVLAPRRDYHPREDGLPNRPYLFIAQTDGSIRNNICDEAVQMDRDDNYRINANYKMGGKLDSLEKIPKFSRTGSKDEIGYSNHLVRSGYANMVDTDMAHSTDGPAGKNQLDLSLMPTEDLKKEFSFYSLSEKNSVHNFSLHNNDMLDLSQTSNLSNFSHFSNFSHLSNGLRGSRRNNFIKGFKPKEATLSDGNTSVSSFTFNGNASNFIGRDLAGEDETDRRDDHGENAHHGGHGINTPIDLNSDYSWKIHGRVLSAASNSMENKGFPKKNKSDIYIAMDNTSSNSGTYYENSLKSNRSNLGTSRQNTLDESHRTYLASGDYFDPNLSHTKLDKNALPGHTNFYTNHTELNESMHNLHFNKTHRNGNSSSWVKSGEGASLKSTGTFGSKKYLNLNNSNNVDLAHSQMSVRAKGITTNHVRDERATGKRKENVHLGSNMDFDNNIFKNFNKEKKLEEEEGKKYGRDVEGVLSEEVMSEVLTHAVSCGKAAVKDEADDTLPISEDNVDRKNINEIYKKINSISMLNDLSLNKLESLNSSIIDMYTKNNEEDGKFLDDIILDDSIFIKSSSLYREEGSPHDATSQGDLLPSDEYRNHYTNDYTNDYTNNYRNDFRNDYRNRFSFSSDPDAADSLFKISLSCNEVVLPIGQASRLSGETGSTYNNRAGGEEAKEEQQKPTEAGHTASRECELEATHCEFKKRAEGRGTSTFRKTTEAESQRRRNSINQLKDKYSKRKDDTMENEMKLSELPSQLDKNMLLKNTLTLQRIYNNMEWRKSKTTALDQFTTPSSSDLLPNETDLMAKNSISRLCANKTDTINRFSKHDMYVHDDKLSTKELNNMPNLFLSKSVFAKCPDLVSNPSGMNDTLGNAYEDAPDDRHALPSREHHIRSEPNSFSISNYSSLTGKAEKGDEVKQGNSFSSYAKTDEKGSNGDPPHCFRGGISGGMRRKRSISDCEGESANVYNDSSVDRIHSDNINGLGNSYAYDPKEGKWPNGGADTGADSTGRESSVGPHNMFIRGSRSSMRSSGKMEWSRLCEAKGSTENGNRENGSRTNGSKTNGIKTNGGKGSSEESNSVTNDLVISKRVSHCAVNHVSGAYPDEEIATGEEEEVARFMANTSEDTNPMRNVSYDGGVKIGKLGESGSGNPGQSRNGDPGQGQNGNPAESQNDTTSPFLRQLSRRTDSQRSPSLVRSIGKEVRANGGKFRPLDKKSTLEEGKILPMVNRKNVEGINYGSQRSKEDQIIHSGMTSMPDILHFGENNNASVFFFDNIHNSSEYDSIPKPLHSSYFESKRKVSRGEQEAIGEGQPIQSNENPFERITKGNVSRTSPLSEGNHPLITRSSMNGSARYPSGENERHFEEDIMREDAANRKVSDEGVPNRQGYLTNQTPSWKSLQRSNSSALFSGPSGNITPSGGFPHEPTLKEDILDDRRSSVGAVFVKEDVQEMGPLIAISPLRSEGTNQRNIQQVQSQKGMQGSEKGTEEGREKDKAQNEAENDVLETCSTSYSFEKSEKSQRSATDQQRGQPGKPYQYVPQSDYKICEHAEGGSTKMATGYDSPNVGGANEEKSNTRKVAIPPSEEKTKVQPNFYDEGDNSSFAHGEERSNRSVSPCNGQRGNTFAGEEKSANDYRGKKKGNTNGFPPRSMPDDMHDNKEMYHLHQRNDSNHDDLLRPPHFHNKPSVNCQMDQGPGEKEPDHMERQNYEEGSIRNTHYSKNSNGPYGDPYRCRSGQAAYVREGEQSYEHSGDEYETSLSKCRRESYTSHGGNIGDYPHGKHFSKCKREDEFYSNHYIDEGRRSNGHHSRSDALSEDAYLDAVKVEREEQNRSEARSGRGMHHRGDKEQQSGGFQSEKNPLGHKNSYDRIDPPGDKGAYDRIDPLDRKNSYERTDSLNTIQPCQMKHPGVGETKMNGHICGSGKGTHPSGIHTAGHGRRNTEDIVVRRTNEIIMAPDRLHDRIDSANLGGKKERNTHDHAGDDFPQERPAQDYPYARCQSRDANYPHEEARKRDNSHGKHIVEMTSTNSYQLKKNDQFEEGMIQHKYSKKGTQHYEDGTNQPIYPFTELLPNDKIHSGHLGSLAREEEFVNRRMEENVREKYSSLGRCEGYENWPQREEVTEERGSERYGPSCSRGADYRYGGLCGEHPGEKYHGERHYEGKHYVEKYHGEKHYSSYSPLYENLHEHSAMVAPPNKIEKSKTSVNVTDHNYLSSGAPYGADFHAPVMPNGAYVKAHTSYVAYGAGAKWKGNSTQPVGCPRMEEKKEAIYNYKEEHLKYDIKRDMYEGKHTGSTHQYGPYPQMDGRNNTALACDYYFDEGARNQVVRRYSKYAQEELNRKGENGIMFHRFGESKDVDNHMERVTPAPSSQYNGGSGGNSGENNRGNAASPVALHYEMKREDHTHGLTPQMGDNYANENKTWNYREGKNGLPFRKANTNYEQYKVGRDMGNNGDDRIYRHSEGDTMHRGGMSGGAISRGIFQPDHNASTSSGRNANYNELLYELFRENIDSQGKEKNSQVLNKIMDVMMNIQNDLKDVKCKLSRKKKSDPPEQGDVPSGDSNQPSGNSRDQPSGQPNGQQGGQRSGENNRKLCDENSGKPRGDGRGKSNCPDSGPARRASPLNNPEQDASLTPVLKNLNYEEVKDSAVSKSNRLYLFSKFFTSVFYEHNVKTHNFIMFNIYNTEQKRQTHKVSLFLERDYNDIYSHAYNNLLFYSFDCYTLYKYIKAKFEGSYKIYENSTLCLYIENNYETNLINRLFIEQNNLHRSSFRLNEKRILKTCTKYVVESFLSLLDKQVNIKNVIPFMKKRNYEMDQRNLYFFISRVNLMDKIFSDSHGFECNKKSFERFSPNVRNFAVFFKYIRDASNFYDSLVGAEGEATKDKPSSPVPSARSNNAAIVAAATGSPPPSRSYRLIIVALHKGKSFHYDKAPFSSLINSGQIDMHHYYNNYDSMTFSNDEVVLFNLSYAVPFYYIEYYRN